MKPPVPSRTTLRVLVLTAVFFIGTLSDMLLIGSFPSLLPDVDAHRLGQLLAKPLFSAVPFLLGGSFLMVNGVYRTGAVIAGFPSLCMLYGSCRLILQGLQALL